MNLLSSEFVKKIYCSSPQRDEFEVESLIENDKESRGFLSRKQNKGFVVDTFIRPPVTIFIIFKKEISVDSIKLDAKVNTQISNGFFVSTSIDPPETIEKSILDNKINLVNFQQVAKIMNEKNKSCHVYEFTKRTPQSSPSQSVNVAYFGARSHLYLDNVTGISISITRTLNSSSACLRSLKVLGRLNKPNVDEINNDSELNSKYKNKSTPEKIDVEIPAEFIDELTHEIMKMPIRLPSRKFVDKSTLDKYLAEETLKNQAPRDPFTRLAFSSDYKPIIDEILKAKIDRFLFDNQNKKLVYKQDKVRKESEQIVNREDLKRNLSLISMDYFKNELDADGEPTSSKKLKPSQPQSCSCCLNLKSAKLTLYQLQTCRHLYCRSCLVSLNRKCAVCKASFKSNQVINADRANYEKLPASDS
jgi:hypothetical protein